MIHLNIGSNLSSKHGSKFYNISLATRLLLESKIKVIKLSNFYLTPSYPNKDFPTFANIGLTVDFKNNYNILLKKILLIERKIGRIRSTKNAPRICDIDIIDFNGKIIKNNEINLPHPRSHLRNFVLYPIREIDPDWIHPICNKNVDSLIKQLKQTERIEITRLRKSVII